MNLLVSEQPVSVLRARCVRHLLPVPFSATPSRVVTRQTLLALYS